MHTLEVSIVLQRCKEKVIWWDESSITNFSVCGRMHVMHQENAHGHKGLTPAARGSNGSVMVWEEFCWHQEVSLQTTAKLYRVATFILWQNISSLMGVAYLRMTVPPSLWQKCSLNGLSHWPELWKLSKSLWMNWVQSLRSSAESVQTCMQTVVMSTPNWDAVCMFFF